MCVKTEPANKIVKIEPADKIITDKSDRPGLPPLPIMIYLVANEPRPTLNKWKYMVWWLFNKELCSHQSRFFFISVKLVYLFVWGLTPLSTIFQLYELRLCTLGGGWYFIFHGVRLKDWINTWPKHLIPLLCVIRNIFEVIRRKCDKNDKVRRSTGVCHTWSEIRPW